MKITDNEIENLRRLFDIRLVADGGGKRGKVFLLRKKAKADAADASAALEPFRRHPDFQVREVLHDATASTKVTELRSLCGERCHAITKLSKPIF